MSFQAMAWAVKQKLPTRDKFVLLMLANYANEFGKCWPSFNRLADDTGLCRRSIILSLQTLSSGGLIDVEERKLDGQNITNIYTVRLDSGELIRSHTVSEGSAVVAPVVNELHHGVVQQMHRGSAVVAPKPINEPIKKRNIYSSFEKFWSSYPRKVGKGAAEKAWVKALQSTEADAIIASLVAYKFSEDVNFIPHPATWLNQRRWEDTMEKPEILVHRNNVCYYIESKSDANYAPWKAYFERKELKFRLLALENAMETKGKYPVQFEFPPND